MINKYREWDFLYWDEDDTDYEDDWVDDKPKFPKTGTTIED